MASEFSRDVADQTSAFWQHFYTTHALRHEPSPFARWCMQHHLTSGQRMLELGCGNGRDTFAFAGHGLALLAIDGCEVAIRNNIAFERSRQREGQSPRFQALDVKQINTLPALHPVWFDGEDRVNVVYSRFFLHAIPEVLEDQLLAFAGQYLPQNGLMLHEFRTTQDPLMQLGEVLSPTERWTDHYRRFIDTAAFCQKVKRLGWKEIHFEERNGLARFGAEDPVVARVVLQR
ncbi:Methyltransferase domain-containing protein [Ectothiorhodospira magna]|uniref:Methyltransferase domain-containing protein n=1 Tax=Ectothiorhodospira magna TaxID=867345 RepID=A0A1H9GNC5_9GAMM|nr:class I SAM-dependent methyltransferase [Ectothiorhodospira magna]SEQ51448.1 Methyltransferase domain-containing protein [Ectothiorhodospira magna]